MIDIGYKYRDSEDTQNVFFDILDRHGDCFPEFGLYKNHSECLRDVL